MPPKQNKGLKKLLEAEAKANEIVKQAKKERLLKLKKAKEEAEIEINIFKNQKQEDFEKLSKNVFFCFFCFFRIFFKKKFFNFLNFFLFKIFRF